MSIRPQHGTPGTLHRRCPSEDWRSVKIICALPWGQFLIEETERVFNGRFAAFRTDMREAGGIFEYGEPFVSKAGRMPCRK